MTLAALATDVHVLNLRARMPFRYGIAAMTALPHVFVRVRLAVDGRTRWGIAAESLAPKWFTKDPGTSIPDDIADTLRTIEAACTFARDAPPAETVFDLWQHVYGAQMGWAAAQGYPALLGGFGVSLVERAAIDAFCRARGSPFARALRDNTLGIRLAAMHGELDGYSPAELLPAQPLRTIIVRHTVGLGDPLTDREIPRGQRIDDGLPQSLEGGIRAYGLTHFKIKLGGDPLGDRERLTRIAAVLGSTVAGPYAFSLDANETYAQVEPFRALWQALAEAADLAPFMRRLLFVEQPLHRDMALSAATRHALEQWEAKPPIIIDESDSDIGSLPAALECGYSGTSHKGCKGIFKGIANACLIAHRRRSNPGGQYVLSGEDLSTVGPVALLQDVAVMANLGIAHVERNGHHYFAGLSMLPQDVQARVLAHHGDLYRRHERGFATLHIRDGIVEAGSLVDAPFGPGFDVDPSRFTPLNQWRADSLDDG